MASSRDLHLPEVIEFLPDEGLIRLHEQRVVILSAAAMGMLRKELVATLGVESTRRLLLRFGYADGYHDAISLRSSRRCRLSGVVVGMGARAWRRRGRKACSSGLGGGVMSS